VAIVQHVDVRRMLLSQKACCEGALALCLYAARLQDVENEGQTPEERAEAASLMALLTPIVKSWPSEFGQVSLHHALQVLGGAGYTRDFEVEQLYRDNRLNPIHEGTTGIQALDLVGRKLRKDRGKSYRLLRARVDASHAAAAPFEALSQAGAALAVVWQEIDAAVEQVLADAEGESLDHATALLSAMGHAVIGWIWLDLATLAAVRMATGGECYVDGYLLGKIKACDYFAQFELPLVAAWLAPLRSKVTMVRDFGIAEFLGEAE
jgi:hypothetical protein